MTEPFEPIDNLAGPGEAKTNAQTLARLVSEVFPEAVTEDGIDFDALRELVGAPANAEVAEPYGISWPGRAAARRLALLSPTGTLLPRPSLSEHWGSSENVLVGGDNLEVLRILRRAYAGKFKVIYIDPPYNTGREFVYNDDFSDGIRAYEEFTEQRDATGRVAANTETSGRFHARWLSMMAPRLSLARDLLAEDGVIYISIDDNEFPRLRMLCDATFGEDCFEGVITWEKRTKAQNTEEAADQLQSKTEYIVVYKKRAMKVHFTREATDQKSYDQSDERGPFRHKRVETMSALGMRGRKTMQFSILGVEPGADKQWKIGAETIAKYQARGDLDLVAGWPTQRIRPEDEPPERYAPFWSHFFDKDTYGTAESGKRELSDILGTSHHGFETVKPVHLLKSLLRHVPKGEDEKNFLVLDFFAGSGTLGQAVMELNSEDGGRRRFFLVQLDEPVEDSSFGTITDITRARLKNAAKRICSRTTLLQEEEQLGFRYYQLGASNTRRWNGKIGEQSLDDAVASAVNNLLPGRNTDDLLVEMMLRLGLELTTPVEQQVVAGSPLYNLGGGTLFAYFGTGITVGDSKRIAQAIRTWRDEEGPVTEAAVVVRDSGFVDSAAKLNLAAALNQAGMTNLRSI